MLLNFAFSPCNRNIMRLLLPVTLFSSCVSTFALPPLITPAPQIAIRDVAPNVCGYYSLGGLSMLNSALSIQMARLRGKKSKLSPVTLAYPAWSRPIGRLLWCTVLIPTIFPSRPYTRGGLGLLMIVSLEQRVGKPGRCFESQTYVLT